MIIEPIIDDSRLLEGVVAITVKVIGDVDTLSFEDQVVHGNTMTSICKK